MFNKIPSIKSIMTPFPYAVGADEPIATARLMMDELRIRHLPVKDQAGVLSIITEREFRGADPGLLIRDVAIKDVYVVDLDEALDNILVHMARHHIGSALVTKDGRLAGIFTSSDACRIFGEWLRYHYRPSNGDDAA
jgi:CBS domain-containing protein